MSAELGLMIVNQAELKSLLADASANRGGNQSALIGKLDGMRNIDNGEHNWIANHLDGRIAAHLDARLNRPFRQEFIWRGTIRPSGNDRTTRIFDYALPGSVDGNRARLDYQCLPGALKDGPEVSAILYFVSNNVLRLDFSYISTLFSITRFPIATFQIEQVI